MKKLLLLLLCTCGMYVQATDFEKLDAGFRKTLPRNIDSAYSLANKMVKQAREAHQPVWEAKALMNKAEAALYMASTSEAVADLEKAVVLAQTDLPTQLRAYLNLGNAHAQLSGYSNALVAYNKALQLAHKTGDKKMQCTCLANMAGIYNMEQAPEKANSCFNRAYALAKETGQPVARLQYGIAMGLLNRGEAAKAQAMALQSLASFRAEADLPGESSVYVLMSEISLSRNKPREAKKYLDEALALALSVNEQFSIADIQLRLGKWYLEKKEFDTALDKTGEVLGLAVQLGSYELRLEAYDLFQRIYSAMGRTRESEHYSALMAQAIDSVQRAKRDLELMRLENKKEERKKQLLQELETRKAERDAAMSKSFYFLMGIIMAVGITVGLVFYFSRRNRKK